MWQYNRTNKSWKNIFPTGSIELPNFSSPNFWHNSTHLWVFGSHISDPQSGMFIFYKISNFFIINYLI